MRITELDLQCEDILRFTEDATTVDALWNCF